MRPNKPDKAGPNGQQLLIFKLAKIRIQFHALRDKDINFCRRRILKD
jgi:hypothetical protein